MPAYQTLPLTYDLGSYPSPSASRWVQSIGGINLTSQTQFVRAETPRFAVAFQDGATGSKVQTNLGTVADWVFTIKSLANYGGANLLRSTTAPTITGTGATTLYTFALASYNTTQLCDAFIILDDDIQELGDDGQLPTLPATQAARYAVTGLAAGYIVRQVDTGTYWRAINENELDNAAGWSSNVSQRSYVDCGLQIDFTIAGVTDKTRALPVRISNDYAQTASGATPINPTYPAAGQLVTYRPEITSLALLAAIATNGVAIPKCIVTLIAAQPRMWELLPLTLATGAGAQRPSDYLAVTNEQVWVSIF